MPNDFSVAGLPRYCNYMDNFGLKPRGTTDNDLVYSEGKEDDFLGRLRKSRQNDKTDYPGTVE